MDWQATRPGETSAPLPERQDAHLIFIGRLRTPFRTRDDCPRQGDAEAGPICRVELDPHWRAALSGIESFATLDLLYWMHEARRDLLTQTPRGGQPVGTFALRSPVRPNPVALSRVALIGVEDGVLLVRGLDCLDGTPLIDIKPNRCSQSQLASSSPDETHSRPPRGEGSGMGGDRPGERGLGQAHSGGVSMMQGSPGRSPPTPIPSPRGGGEEPGSSPAEARHAAP